MDNFDMNQVVEIFSKIAMVVGTIRLFVKPIMHAIEKTVMETPTKRDDVWLQKVQASNTFKTIMFLLDYLGSLKLVELNNVKDSSVIRSESKD